VDIAALQARLRRFAEERDWERFHAPKNLAMALGVEAAEPAAIAKLEKNALKHPARVRLS